MVRLTLTTLSAVLLLSACGSGYADYCDTDQPGVQVLIDGYPAGTESVELVVREVEGQTGCDSDLWATQPLGLAEDRDYGVPGEVLRSSVDLDRYPELDLFAYAYDGPLTGEATHGSCMHVVVTPEDGDLICLTMLVSKRP